MEWWPIPSGVRGSYKGQTVDAQDLGSLMERMTPIVARAEGARTQIQIDFKSVAPPAK